MIPITRIPSVMSLGLLLTLSGALQAQTRLTVPCTVRIRPITAADYDLGSELTLQGRLVGREGRLLLLEFRTGLVRVDPGPSAEAQALLPGSLVAVVAARLQEDGRQRLLARQLRVGDRTQVLRDALGVPVQL